MFATSAMSCCDKTSIKIVPRSLRKQLSNQHPNLDRFWSQLGSILRRLWGSRWSQDGTKSLQQSIQKTITKMITFWIASRSIFDRFWAPTWGVQRGPFVVCRATFSPLEPLLEPECAKALPKSPKIPPRCLLGLIFVDFGLQVGGFLEPT